MASSHWISLDVNGVRVAFYIGCVRGLLKSVEMTKLCPELGEHIGKKMWKYVR